MQPFLAFVLLSTICGLASCYDYGYDAGSDEGACRQRTGRSRSATPPCDLARQMYCATAGASYPWHAVRRFVRENRGLMRRMYGDQRHISVLRAEFEEEPPISEFGAEGRMAKGLGNEVYYQEVDREREVEEEVLDAKFVYAVDPTVSIKLGEFRAPPRFRPTTTPTTATATTSTTHLTSKNVTDTISTTEATTEAFTTETAEFTTDTTETTSTQRSQLASESPSSTSSSESAVKGEVLFQDAASEDVGDVSESEEIEEDNHVNYNLKGVNACPVKEEVVAPFWANNTRGELLALLNLYPYEQYVHWEKCTHEHRRMYCRKGCRCEQQYRLHRLLAYDPNNECRGIFSDWFRFPSCCVCKCYDVPMEFRVTSRSPRRIKFDGADGGRTRGNRRA